MSGSSAALQKSGESRGFSSLQVLQEGVSPSSDPLPVAHITFMCLEGAFVQRDVEIRYNPSHIESRRNFQVDLHSVHLTHVPPGECRRPITEKP